MPNDSSFDPTPARQVDCFDLQTRVERLERVVFLLLDVMHGKYGLRDALNYDLNQDERQELSDFYDRHR